MSTKSLAEMLRDIDDKITADMRASITDLMRGFAPMPGSGRERGKQLGFVNCKHCKWKGHIDDMKLLPSQKGLPDHKRPRGYCPTCGGKCMWMRVSPGQWRVLQP